MTTLLLVGHGKMGSALLSRWAETRAAGVNHIAVVDPNVSHSSSPDVRFFSALDKIPEGFKPGIVVFAVKPQQLADVAREHAARFKQAPLYLSIAAGTTLHTLANYVGDVARIVRAMPNTPAAIGEGMTTLAANAEATETDKETAEALMRAAGNTLWIEETDMDAATAIAGSGPAYVFLFMEALKKAATECGLSEDAATQLVRQTLRGSAMLAEEADFATLRKNVTSPGGTTETAINVLQSGGFERLICDAARAAMQRAKELNK